MIKNQTPLTPEQIEAELAKLYTTIDQFAAEMKQRLAVKVHENRTGWDNPALAETIYNDLLAHAAGSKLAAGHEIDIANFAMFLWCQRLQQEGASK